MYKQSTIYAHCYIDFFARSMVLWKTDRPTEILWLWLNSYVRLWTLVVRWMSVLYTDFAKTFDWINYIGISTKTFPFLHLLFSNLPESYFDGRNGRITHLTFICKHPEFRKLPSLDCYCLSFLTMKSLT